MLLLLILIFKNLGIPSSKFFNLLDYGFNDFGLDDDDTIRACIRMFLDLDLLERFHINYEVRDRLFFDLRKFKISTVDTLIPNLAHSRMRLANLLISLMSLTCFNETAL